MDPGRGSLLQPERLCCVGLCGTFVWLPPHLPEQLNSLAVGTLPQAAAVNRTGEKAPITRAACGLRAAACGDGVVAGPLACVHLRGASQHHVRCCVWADMKLFHLFPRHLFVDKGFFLIS